MNNTTTAPPSTLSSAPCATAPATPARSANTPGRLVTDAPTRMFHALFALSFVGAYLTAESESWRALHVTLGYTMAGLLGFRLSYGLFGPRQAGLSVLWRKLSSLPQWLQLLRQNPSPSAPHWRQGQNLAMAAAILGMLLLVLPMTLTGYALYNDLADSLGGDWIEEAHELAANAFLALVLGHLALITGLSFLRRKNMARPMLSGRVEGQGPDLVKQPRKVLAAVLLILVLAFGAWEWTQAPDGLIPGVSTSQQSDETQDD